MALVSVDERGRLLIPKELGVRGARAIVIPAGSFFVIIPLPKQPSEFAKAWLSTHKGRSDLKAAAERSARKDAIARARRRKQI